LSKKQRKVKKKLHKAVNPAIVLSNEQNSRLQQAIQAQSAGQFAFAEAAYRALLAEKIRTPQVYCNLAQVCAQSARRNEADVLWKKALAIDPRSVEARMNLADSCQLAGDIEGAIKHYQRVLSAHKQFVIAKYLLANLLKSQGKLEEAADKYKQIMTQQPDYTQAHFTYSSIHKYRDETDPHISSMLGLYQKGNLKNEGKIHLAFALAKAFEDIGDYPRSFEYLKSGNDLRSAESHYDIESDRGLIQNIIQVFNKDAISGVQIDANESDRPIFIVGMPRSGTSLVEKIIASHSDVYGAGELDYIFSLGTGLFLKESANYQFKSLDSYPAQKYEAVGRTYLEQINQLNSQAPRITDKMPFNMMMVGLIKIALPNAKIIHCVRDAKDTCLSIFKQNFTTGNYRFAYNLKTVAQFHKQYQMLMQHWHEVMPGEIYDISYESLTQSPEHEIRALLSACDLDFQQSCVNFEKSDAVVKTASAFQVRQPMYTSSVKLWESYREFLGPMLDELEQA